MGQSGKPLTKSRYPTVSLPGHPLAWKGGVVRIHRATLYDAIGPGSHPCHWCGKDVTWGADLVADHVDADTWNNNPSNLVASCATCNVSRPGAGNAGKTHCKWGHEFTPQNTYWRKGAKDPDKRTRQCKACSKGRARARGEHIQKTSPKRAGLHVPLAGLTVGDLREFVASVREMDASTPVFTTTNRGA